MSGNSSLFFSIIIIIIIPLFIFLPNEALLGRFQSVSQNARLEDIDKSILYYKQDNFTNISKIIHNRRIIIGQTYLKNYLLHFDLNYLFSKGDANLRFHTKNMGMLYFFHLPVLVIGLFYFLKIDSDTCSLCLLGY